MKPALLILAAGAGTRYGGLKQLAPIGPNGESLLEYSAFDAARAGFDRMILVVRRDTESAFRARLDGGMALHLPTTYVHQRLDDLPTGHERPPGREKPWGTGHAVLAAEPRIDCPFTVINADDYYGPRSYSALFAFLTAGRPDCHLASAGFRVGDTLTDSGPVSRAVLEVDERGRLRKAVELLAVSRENGEIYYRHANGLRQRLNGDELVSMNMWGFTPALFAELRQHFAGFLDRSGQDPSSEFLLPEVVQSLVCQGRFEVKVLPRGGEWFGITFREDQPRVRKIISSLIDRGRYPRELWA